MKLFSRRFVYTKRKVSFVQIGRLPLLSFAHFVLAKAKTSKTKTWSRKVTKNCKAAVAQQPLDIYNTVWLSDSVRSCATRSVCSTLNQSGGSLAHEYDDSLNCSSRSSRSSHRELVLKNHQDRGRNNLTGILTTTGHAYRTLSLPELSNLNGVQLQDRFIRLQLEQENRELQKTVEELHADLEEVYDFTRTNYDQNCPCCFENLNKINTLVNATRHPVDAKRLQASADTTRNNESGYDTMPNDSTYVGDDDDKEHKHSDWSFSDISDGSSHQEEAYFESRLLKRPRKIYEEDGSNCCRVQ